MKSSAGLVMSPEYCIETKKIGPPFPQARVTASVEKLSAYSGSPGGISGSSRREIRCRILPSRVITKCGGSVTNDSTGSIRGWTAGVSANGAALTLSNAGAIAASGGPGVDIEAGGSVSNEVGGTISGSGFGIFLTGGTGIVINDGSIFEHHR